MTKTIEQVSREFHARTEDYSNRMVQWMITYSIGMVDAKKLWPVFERALKHKVIANEKYYGSTRKYDKIGRWIDENCKGMWTHSGITYLFEFEEDAMAFKSRWA